jgi:hypothetical protein
MQNNAANRQNIAAMMQQFVPGFTEEEMEFGPEEFEDEAYGMYEMMLSQRFAPKARKAAGGGSSAPRKRTKKAAPRPPMQLPPSYETDGTAAAAGQLIMASAPSEILSRVFLQLGPLNNYGQLSLVNKHWREALQVCANLHERQNMIFYCLHTKRVLFRSVMLTLYFLLTLRTASHCRALSRCLSYGLT